MYSRFAIARSGESQWTIVGRRYAQRGLSTRRWPNFEVSSVTPGSFDSAAICRQIACAAPGTVNAARLAVGSSGSFGSSRLLGDADASPSCRED